MFTTFDFNTYSGFPFDQQIMRDMQANYTSSINALCRGLVGDYASAFVVSGLTLTSGTTTSGVASSGVIYAPGKGLLYCAGGSFTSATQAHFKLEPIELEHEGSVMRESQFDGVVTLDTVAGDVQLGTLMSRRIDNVLLTLRTTHTVVNNANVKVFALKNARTGMVTVYGEWLYVLPTLTDESYWARMTALGAALPAAYRPIADTFGVASIVSADGSELSLPRDYGQHPVSSFNFKVGTNGVVSIQSRWLNLTASPTPRFYFSLTFQSAT